MEIKVNKGAGQIATVKLYGKDYKVKLGDDNTAEILLYGQKYSVVGTAAVKKTKKAKNKKSISKQEAYDILQSDMTVGGQVSDDNQD